MVPIAVTTAQITIGLLGAAALAAAGWFVRARLLQRPERRLAAARNALDRGDWSAALNEVRRLSPAAGAKQATWHDSRRLLEGECLEAAGEVALRENNFEEALARFHEAAPLADAPVEEPASRVATAMLAEARRLFLTDAPPSELPTLLERIRACQPDCPEADFLAGLHELKAGNTQKAIEHLTAAGSVSPGKSGDAGLYLGGISLRAGHSREALRYLADANKIASQCPIVAWQMGMALATAGESVLAIRALQKATGPDGMPRFLADPDQLWIETLPADSWIRSLARDARKNRVVYRCPLGFHDLKSALLTARRALGEALVQAGRAEDALRILNDLLATDDSAFVRRNLGAALSLLQRFDEAQSHLRQAFAQEQPPNPRTAAALALSLVKSRGDKKANAAAAMDLVTRHPARGDAAWASQAGAVLAGAQETGVAISPDQIGKLVEHFVSAVAHDSSAAALYDRLARHDLDSVPFEAACLYVRTAQQHGVRLTRDLELFQRAFDRREELQRFFASHNWDHAAAERLFLERWAERYPGSFPKFAGADAGTASEAVLLDDSRRLESLKKLDAALATAELALKLAPASGPAHDRLAELAFRRKDIAGAIEWLTKWGQLAPNDPAPRARLASVMHSLQRLREAAAAADEAIALAHGKARASMSLLAARIAASGGKPDQALDLLNSCLTDDATNATALTARAAFLWVRGDKPGLTNLVGRLADVPGGDAWARYLGAVCAFAAGRTDMAAEAAANAGGEAASAGFHLSGLLHTQQGREKQAIAALQSAVQSSQGPTADHARALLGQIAWYAGDYSEALKWWQPLAPAALKSCRLDAVIPGGALLAGLSALRGKRWEAAGKWLRAAARLRCADARLGVWLGLACDGSGNDGDEPVIGPLQSAIEAAGPHPALVQRLARRLRRNGKLAETRQTLDSATIADAGVHVERGLLALAERQLLAAERNLAEAVALDPQFPAAVLNLMFVQLSLGRIDAAVTLLPKAMQLAPTDSLKRLCHCLRRLIDANAIDAGNWSAIDDELVLDFIRRVGRWETATILFDALARLRGSSPSVRKAHAEIAALRAKDMIDRGEAASLLRRFGPIAQAASPVLQNLLGVAAALRQDFDSAIRHFTAALPQAGDARIEQNLALVREWQGDLAVAIVHWRRYLEGRPGKSVRLKEIPDYRRRIETLAMDRLNQAESALQSAG